MYYRFVGGNHYEAVSMKKIGSECCEVCKKFTYKVCNEIIVPPNLKSGEKKFVEKYNQITLIMFTFCYDNAMSYMEKLIEVNCK